MIADILGKNRLHRLGFNIPVSKVTARQAVMLNKAAEELPSESDITKADDIELQEICRKSIRYSFSDKRRPDRYRGFIRTSFMRVVRFR